MKHSRRRAQHHTSCGPSKQASIDIVIPAPPCSLCRNTRGAGAQQQRVPPASLWPKTRRCHGNSATTTHTSLMRVCPRTTATAARHVCPACELTQPMLTLRAPPSVNQPPQQCPRQWDACVSPSPQERPRPGVYTAPKRALGALSSSDTRGSSAGDTSATPHHCLSSGRTPPPAASTHIHKLPKTQAAAGTHKPTASTQACTAGGARFQFRPVTVKLQTRQSKEGFLRSAKRTTRPPHPSCFTSAG